MGPAKVFCFAFLRHSDNSPASSIAEPSLSVFGTLWHRHMKPCTKNWGLRGAPQTLSQHWVLHFAFGSPVFQIHH